MEFKIVNESTNYVQLLSDKSHSTWLKNWFK